MNFHRLQLDRQERQSQVEATRLNNETASLRQRLDRADSDLMHARREQLRLNEQISALEKEASISYLNIPFKAKIIFKACRLEIFYNFFNDQLKNF